MKHHSALLFALFAVITLIISACNLGAAPEQGEESLTQEIALTIPPTRTPAGTLSLPTALPLTRLAPTSIPGQVGQPTRVVVVPPTSVLPPTQQGNTGVPVSIVILSPIPGNVVAGNVQVLGSASHPQFLQYQLEFGPDPNPGNLWYPITGAIQVNTLNNLLGIWNTNAVQDGTYQLRLRVFLRDSSSLTTVVNNVRVQNRVPTTAPSPTPNIPRPIAAFSASPTTGQVPLTVRFNNQSTGNITSYQWNFGDGTTSDRANPRHDYTSPGLYTVTLSVSGPGGNSNVSSQINVQSPSAPSAGFTADKFNGTAPLTVQFTDTSAGNVTSYHWNFSDGTGSTERNPRHVFNAPGTYNVFLTVIGPGGSSSARREITVQGPTQTPLPTLTSTIVPPPTNTSTATPEATATSATLPTAAFTSQLTGDLTVQFTNTSTSASGGITGRTWDFGDGATSTDQNPSHTYAAPGLYTVTLTVTDAAGSNQTSQQVDVPAPLAPVEAGFSAAPAGDLTIQFTDTSTTGASGGITAWAWDFGDGSPTGSEPNPVHAFPAAGTYTITLTVTDSEGRTDSVSNNVDVAAPAVPPEANFTSQPAGDLAVQFLDTTTGQTAITTWAWDFGDGSTSNEQNPVHTYGAGGTYPVTLTVTDANGQTDSVTNNVDVAAPAVPPEANFSSQPAGDLAIQFMDTSTGQNPITAWAWDFGDGSTSNEQNPVHTYGAGGMYTVTLMVTDSNGQTDSVSNTVEVTAPVVEVPDQPGIVENTPPLPNINDQAIRNNLRAIYENGLAQGNRPTVFSVAGDISALHGSYLDPFRNNSDYALDGETAGLQGIIDWYNLTDIEGATSFNRNSLAAAADWRINAMLNPERADPNVCAGETPLACELRVAKPSVVIISIGYQDVSQGTNVDDFRSRLQSAVDTATGMGVIPVLTTIQPRPDNPDAVREFNEAIIEVANANNIPVYNLWARFNALPDSGLSGDGVTPSQAPGVPGDITGGAASNFGANARNRDVLTILNDIRNTIFPDATP